MPAGECFVTCVACSSVECLRLLLAAPGSSPDARTVRHETPLMLAACWGHPSAVQKLLAAGADATLKNKVRAAAAEAREGQVRPNGPRGAASAAAEMQTCSREATRVGAGLVRRARVLPPSQPVRAQTRLRARGGGFEKFLRPALSCWYSS